MGGRSIFLIFCIGVKLCASQNVLFRPIRDCLNDDNAIACLKEQLLIWINRTIHSNQSMNILGVVSIVKEGNYTPSRIDEVLPQNVTERSIALNDMIYEKLEELFNSRKIKINIGSVFEGRKKGGGGIGGKKGNNMMLVGAMAMAGMIGQLMMGKLAFMSGAALLMSKLALLLAAIVGFKKLNGGSGGGGGESAHVIYASSNDGYGSHGGWHRSITYNENPENIAYKNYAPVNDNGNIY